MFSKVGATTYHIVAAKFCIKHIVLRHGTPEVHITNTGTTFTAELTQGILTYGQTSPQRTAAYRPPTDGLTDHLNKIIADMLAEYIVVKYKMRDVILPYVTKQYRSAENDAHDTTKVSLLKESRTDV